MSQSLAEEDIAVEEARFRQYEDHCAIQRTLTTENESWGV